MPSRSAGNLILSRSEGTIAGLHWVCIDFAEEIKVCITYNPSPCQKGEKGTKKAKQIELSPLGKTRRALEGRQRFLPWPRGRGVLPSSHRIQRPTLPGRDHYLVEMRVPGDIVSSLLQGHGARRAWLGVAALGRNERCLAPEGAAGHAWQGGQPRPSDQRGAHGLRADLEPGRDQGQGCPLAKPGPARQQSVGPESGHVFLERLGAPDGFKAPASAPPPRPTAPGSVSMLRATASPGKAKRKQAQKADPVRMTARAIPAPTQENRRLHSQGSPHSQSLWLALVPPSSPHLAS